MRRTAASNRTRGTLVGLAMVIALTSAVFFPAAAPARGFKLGLFDGVYATSQTHALWLQRSWEAGARLVQVGVDWRQVAPTTRAADFDPADPADPGYRFETLDSVVKEARAQGFEVVFFVQGAPSWAEGPNRPGPAVGAWRPDPIQFGQFAGALAKRYSGTLPDPLNSRAVLPRVRHFRIWNEPNLSVYLTPQWAGKRPVGPDLYRGLLNAAYAAIKAVNRQNVVIAGGLAPFGDEPGEERMRPIVFLRRLFCLRARTDQRIRGCGPPARFDVLSHHPINQAAPRQSAESPLDVTTPDLGRIKVVLRAARKLGTIRPRRPKPLWVTEFWWVSNPPSSFGVPPRKQARWLEEALYLFWKQGVRVAFWLAIRDPEPAPDAIGLGLYFANGTPKPALRAFRFPLVVSRALPAAAAVSVWGITPSSGPVTVQRRRGAKWVTVKRIAHKRPGVFTTRLQVPGKATMRAVTSSGESSLPWTVRGSSR